jgi:hypothetical protein
MLGVGLCAACVNAERFFGQLPDVLIMSMVTLQSPLYDSLRGYKNDRFGDAQVRHRRVIAASIASFVGAHKTCFGDYDVLALIPSPNRTALLGAIRIIGGLRDRYEAVLKPDGPKERTSSQRFTAAESVAGKRVLSLMTRSLVGRRYSLRVMRYVWLGRSSSAR